MNRDRTKRGPQKNARDFRKVCRQMSGANMETAIKHQHFKGWGVVKKVGNNTGSPLVACFEILIIANISLGARREALIQKFFGPIQGNEPDSMLARPFKKRFVIFPGKAPLLLIVNQGVKTFKTEFS